MCDSKQDNNPIDVCYSEVRVDDKSRYGIHECIVSFGHFRHFYVSVRATHLFSHRLSVHSFLTSDLEYVHPITFFFLNSANMTSGQSSDSL